MLHCDLGTQDNPKPLIATRGHCSHSGAGSSALSYCASLCTVWGISAHFIEQERLWALRIHIFWHGGVFFEASTCQALNLPFDSNQTGVGETLS